MMKDQKNQTNKPKGGGFSFNCFKIFILCQLLLTACNPVIFLESTVTPSPAMQISPVSSIEPTITPLPVNQMLRQLPMAGTSLLFYDPTSGEAVFYKTDASVILN